MRKFLITLLTVVCTGCMLFALACSTKADFEAKFKETAPKEVFVGTEIDLEDFIIRVEGADVTMTVEYSTINDGDRKETFIGLDTIFYPKAEGEHTLTYTATKGRASASATYKFTAKSQAPSLSFADRMYQVSLNRKTPTLNVSLLSVMTQLDMYVRPIELIPEIVSVERSVYNPELEDYTEHDFTEKLPFTPGMLSYKFTEAGMYRFTASVTTGGGTTTAPIYIWVEKGEASRSYKSRIDDEGLVTISAGRYSRSGGAWKTDYGYYGMGLYEVGDTLEISYTGQNLPNIALFADVNSGQSIGGGTGLYFQTSNNSAPWSSRLMICGPDRLETGNKADYASYDGADLGKNGMIHQEHEKIDGYDYVVSPFGLLMMDAATEYKMRYTSEASTAGKVKITVELLKNDGGQFVSVKKATYDLAHGLETLSGTYAVAYSAGTYFGQPVSFKYQITSTRRTASVTKNSDSFDVTLKGSSDEPSFYGAESMGVKDGVELFFDSKANVADLVLYGDKFDNKTTEGKGFYFTLTDAGLQMYTNRKTGEAKVYTGIKLTDIEDGTDYRLKLTPNYSDGKLEFDVTLDKVTDEVNDVYQNLKTLKTDAVDFANGGESCVIMLGKATDVVCGFRLDRYLPKLEGDVITLHKGSEDYHFGEAYTNWNYVTASLAQGKTLSISFIGKNMPNVVLLSDSDEVQAFAPENKGYAFIAAQTQPTGNKRFHVSGPNRIALDSGSGIFGRNDVKPGTPSQYQGVGASLISSAGDGKDKIAYIDFVDNIEYKLNISTNKTANGVMIKYCVFDLTNDRVVRLIELEVKDDYAKSLFADGTEEYFVNIYGNAIAKTELIYSIADTASGDFEGETPTTPTPPSGGGGGSGSGGTTGVQPDANGNVTLAKGTEDYHAATAMTDWEYTSFALAQGDVLTVSFIGKNIPNAVILSDTEGGQVYAPNLNGYAYITAQKISSAVSRFYASGPNRACIDANSMFGRGDTYLSALGNPSASDPVGRGSLEDGVAYELAISTAKKSNGVQIGFVLTKNGGTLVADKTVVVTDDYAKSLFANGTESYWVMLYGNSHADTKFSVKVAKAPTVDYTQPDGSVLLPKGSEDYHLASAYTDWAYVSTELGQAQTLTVTFTGKNMPNVVMLSTTQGGQAYDLSLNGYAFISAQTNSVGKQRFYASGPNRAALDNANGHFGANGVAPTNTQYQGVGTGLISSGGTGKDKLAYSDFVDGTEYKLVITTVKSANGVTISYNVYDMTNNGAVVREITKEATDDYAKGLFAAGTEKYFVMLYGNAIQNTQFKYQVTANA